MKRQYSLILAVSFMIFYNVAYGIEIIDCGSKSGKLTDFKVSGCDLYANSCILKRGTKVQYKMGFTIFEDAFTVIAAAYAEDNTSFLPLGASRGCVTGGLKCPLRNGTQHEYKGMLNVLAQYPTLVGSVTWKMLDQNRNTIVCVKFSATFV